MSTDAETDRAEGERNELRATKESLPLTRLTGNDLRKEMSQLNPEQTQTLNALMAEQGLQPEDYFRERGNENNSDESDENEPTDLLKMNTDANDEDGDFDASRVLNGEDLDDEETMAQAEMEDSNMNAAEETDALQAEMDIPLEEILRRSGIDTSLFQLGEGKLSQAADLVDPSEVLCSLLYTHCHPLYR